MNGEAITVVERKKFLRLSKQERREFGDPFEKHTEIRSIIDINVAEDNRKRTSSANLRCIDTDSRIINQILDKLVDIDARMKVANPVSSTNIFGLYFEVWRKEGFLITNLKMLRLILRSIRGQAAGRP